MTPSYLFICLNSLTQSSACLLRNNAHYSQWGFLPGKCGWDAASELNPRHVSSEVMLIIVNGICFQENGGGLQPQPSNSGDAFQSWIMCPLRACTCALLRETFLWGQAQVGVPVCLLGVSPTIPPPTGSKERNATPPAFSVGTDAGECGRRDLGSGISMGFPGSLLLQAQCLEELHGVGAADSQSCLDSRSTLGTL